MKRHDAVVVGGGGAVGTMLAGLLVADGMSVLAVDTKPGPAPGEGIDRVVGDVLEPDADLVSRMRDASIVVLAVPESVATRTSLFSIVENGLLVETLSVKSGFADVVTASSSPGPVLGINPMFAPSLGMTGRPVAAVTHRPGRAVEEFLRSVSSWGGTVVNVDADTHDRLAAATQALTHASILAFGTALARLDVPADVVDAIAPPPARASLALLARIAGGEPEVYWDVQSANPYAAAARSALVDATRELDDVVATDSEVRFAEFVRRAGSTVPDDERYGYLCARMFGNLQGSVLRGEDRP